jgi:DNA-directed RNA polymerase specialized sigma24 family protein
VTPPFAERIRTERAFGQLYRRHVADVYRYALVLVGEEERAENITRATFLNAFHALEHGEEPDSTTHAWLIRIAHMLCRPDGARQMRAAGREAYPSPRPAPRRLRDLACDGAERAISRRLDRKLPRAEALRLDAHLQRCSDCAAFEHRQRLKHLELRGVAVVPLPETLQSIQRV